MDLTILVLGMTDKVCSTYCTKTKSIRVFLQASDWQAVLGQLAHGRKAEEFGGAKVQAGAMQHSVSCQQPYSGTNPD